MKPYRKWMSSIDTSRSGLVAVVVLTVFLLLRNSGVHPTVMGDEWHYSALSRLLKLSESSDPDYLYLALFRLTNYCGDGYLQCARIMNTAWLLLGAGFIYLIARRFSSSKIATLVAIAAIASPYNTYTVYFMPESMYFGVFWILVWFALNHFQEGISRYSVGLGVILAILSLTKPHALFLLPGLLAFLAYKTYKANPSRLLSVTASTCIPFLVTTLAVRAAIGYMAAGKAGLSLFGQRYTSMASDSNSLDHVMQTGISSAEVLWHHLVVLAVLFGVPISAWLSNLCSAEKWTSKARDEAFSVQVLAIVIIAPLVAVTAAFTVLAVGSGPYETLNRLHMRYYDFAIPFFYIIAATSSPSCGKSASSSRAKRIITILVTAVAVYGLFRLPALFQSSLVDGPDARVLTYNKEVFLLLALCGLLALVTQAFREFRGEKLFVRLFLPLFIVASLFCVSRDIRNRIHEDDYDRAGEIARRFLSPDDRARLVVVGHDVASLLRTLFYIDSQSASLLQLKGESMLKANAIPPDRKWILLIGEQAQSTSAATIAKTGHYALFKIDQVDFSEIPSPTLVESVDGLSQPEPIGTWSRSGRVRIVFRRALPKHFSVKFNAAAFGPNVNERFTMTVGSDARPFYLSNSPTGVVLSFDNDQSERQLVIDVPKPVSPKQLGISSDDRALGIRLINLQILPSGID